MPNALPTDYPVQHTADNCHDQTLIALEINEQFCVTCAVVLLWYSSNDAEHHALLHIMLCY